MLQLAIATHVQIADKVILLCQSATSTTDGRTYPTDGHAPTYNIVPANSMKYRV